MDSEGLLLLTDDGRLARRIAHPRHNQPKTYLAQVEGVVDENALQQLRGGLLLHDGKTRPAQARAVDEPDWLWPRDPPVRHRKTRPDSWQDLTLREARTRQLRRTTASG